MASRSKVQNWIFSKSIQLLTIIQLICLVIFVLSTLPTYMPKVSYYFSPYLSFFLKESEHKKIPALASIVFINICLIYYTWMEKTSFDYWKWREEMTGGFLLMLLNIIGTVSNDLKVSYIHALLNSIHKALIFFSWPTFFFVYGCSYLLEPELDFSIARPQMGNISVLGGTLKHLIAWQIWYQSMILLLDFGF